MSNNLEAIVTKWLDHIIIMENLHNQAHIYYNNKNIRCVTYIMFVLIITGIYGLIEFHSYYITMIISIINIFTAFILSYSKYMNWTKSSLDHQHNVTAYIKVRKLIELHIIMVTVDKNETMCDMIPEIASLLTKIESENIRLPDHLKPKIIKEQIIIDQDTPNKNIFTSEIEPIEIFTDQLKINKQTPELKLQDISDN